MRFSVPVLPRLPEIRHAGLTPRRTPLNPTMPTPADDNTTWTQLLSWFDASRRGADDDSDRIDWVRIAPFLAMHAACAFVLVVGWSPVAVAVAVALYFVRMFAITGFYHRYFSHRSFKTSRALQFAFGVLGATSVQRGPLWWAAHHRKHHRHSDMPEDVHSPVVHSLAWSHVGWITTPGNFATDNSVVPDLAAYRELRFLDRFDLVIPVLFAAALFGLGAWLEAAAPQLGTSGGQMLVWGLISTVVLFHATFTINSLAHRYGTRRFETTDESRNNFWLALLTLGEGWHNNHHHYPHSVRQGFRWWEVDITYYLLRVMSWCGLIWDLRPVPRALTVRGSRS